MGERGREGLEPAIVAARLGDLVEAPLGLLDLGAGRVVDRRVEGDVDHLLADGNQAAPHRQIVDGATIIGRVDDGGGLGGESREILRHREPADIVLAQPGLQRHRGGDLAGPDQGAGHLEDAAVNLLAEMLRLQEVRDPVEGVVVDEDGAEQRLLGLDVVRGNPVAVGARLGRGAEPAPAAI